MQTQVGTQGLEALGALPGVEETGSFGLNQKTTLLYAGSKFVACITSERWLRLIGSGSRM